MYSCFFLCEIIAQATLTVQKYKQRNKKIYVQRKKTESYTAFKQNS